MERRSAFVLTHVLGLECDEAAEMLDCLVGTMGSGIARARVDLVAMMREPGDDADGVIAR